MLAAVKPSSRSERREGNLRGEKGPEKTFLALFFGPFLTAALLLSKYGSLRWLMCEFPGNSLLNFSLR
jgi:hypothetical protein